MTTKILRAPGWVETWIDKLVAPRWEAPKPPTLRDLNRGIIRDAVASTPDGRRLLRDAALRRLESEHPDDVVFGLGELVAIGESADIPAIQRLLDHPVQRIRDDARNCITELQRRG